MMFFGKLKQNLHQTRRFYQQNAKQQRHDIFNHNRIEFAAHEFFAGGCKFVHDVIGRDKPPYQYASANFKHGHHDIVAYVIQQIQHLRLDTVGHIDLKIKDIVAEAHHHGNRRYNGN